MKIGRLRWSLRMWPCRDAINRVSTTEKEMFPLLPYQSFAERLYLLLRRPFLIDEEATAAYSTFDLPVLNFDAIQVKCGTMALCLGGELIPKQARFRGQCHVDLY